MSIFKKKNRRGANAIEFALTLPFFCAITFSFMEFGWYATQAAQVQSALGNACREASIVDPLNPNIGGCSGNACVEKMAQDQLVARINSASMTCLSCTGSVIGSVPERRVRCRAQVEYTSVVGVVPLVGQVLPVGTILDYSTQVRLEWQRQ